MPPIHPFDERRDSCSAHTTQAPSTLRRLGTTPRTCATLGCTRAVESWQKSTLCVACKANSDADCEWAQSHGAVRSNKTKAPCALCQRHVVLPRPLPRPLCPKQVPICPRCYDRIRLLKPHRCTPPKPASLSLPSEYNTPARWTSQQTGTSTRVPPPRRSLKTVIVTPNRVPSPPHTSASSAARSSPPARTDHGSAGSSIDTSRLPNVQPVSGAEAATQPSSPPAVSSTSISTELEVLLQRSSKVDMAMTFMAGRPHFNAKGEYVFPKYCVVPRRVRMDVPAIRSNNVPYLTSADQNSDSSLRFSSPSSPLHSSPSTSSFSSSSSSTSTDPSSPGCSPPPSAAPRAMPLQSTSEASTSPRSPPYYLAQNSTSSSWPSIPALLLPPAPSVLISSSSSPAMVNLTSSPRHSSLPHSSPPTTAAPRGRPPQSASETSMSPRTVPSIQYTPADPRTPSTFKPVTVSRLWLPAAPSSETIEARSDRPVAEILAASSTFAPPATQSCGKTSRAEASTTQSGPSVSAVATLPYSSGASGAGPSGEPSTAKVTTSDIQALPPASVQATTTATCEPPQTSSSSLQHVRSSPTRPLVQCSSPLPRPPTPLSPTSSKPPTSHHRTSTPPATQPAGTVITDVSRAGQTHSLSITKPSGSPGSHIPSISSPRVSPAPTRSQAVLGDPWESDMSELTPLESSDSSSESEQEVKAVSKTQSALQKNVKRTSVCMAVGCHNLLARRAKCTTCVTCRVQKRKPLSRPQFHETNATETRTCSVRWCRVRLSAGYLWKTCEACRMRATEWRRNRKRRRDLEAEGDERNVKKRKVLTSEGVSGVRPRVLSMLVEDLTPRRPVYATASAVISNLRMLLVDFLATTADQVRSEGSPAHSKTFTFESEFSVVVDPAGGNVSARLLSVQKSVAEAVGVQFRLLGYRRESGGVTGQWSCVRELFVPLPSVATESSTAPPHKSLASSGTYPPSGSTNSIPLPNATASSQTSGGEEDEPAFDVLVKRMFGGLSVSVLWDRSHKLFPGLKTVVVFKLGG